MLLRSRGINFTGLLKHVLISNNYASVLLFLYYTGEGRDLVVGTYDRYVRFRQFRVRFYG